MAGRQHASFVQGIQFRDAVMISTVRSFYGIKSGGIESSARVVSGGAHRYLSSG